MTKVMIFILIITVIFIILSYSHYTTLWENGVVCGQVCATKCESSCWNYDSTNNINSCAPCKNGILSTMSSNINNLSYSN